MPSKSEFSLTGRYPFFLIVTFFSGMTSLAYQFFWLKRIGLMLGSTSQVAGLTFGLFFVGLGLGSWFFGKKSSQGKNPLKLFALLELGIALAATTFFIAPTLFGWFYKNYAMMDASPIWLTLLQFSAAAFLVFPASFFMGGTIPASIQSTVRYSNEFGKRGALLYMVNILGAIIGTLVASFFLPLWLGYNLAFCLILTGSLLIALATLLASKKFEIPTFENNSNKLPIEPPIQQKSQKTSRNNKKKKKTAENSVVKPPENNLQEISVTVIFALAALSGLSILALEVIWTRLFSQLLENSVYTYASVLCAILIGLAVGSGCSSLLRLVKLPQHLILTILLALAGLAIITFPWLFLTVTSDMSVISSQWGVAAHNSLVFGKVIACTLPVTITCGTIFPYLMTLCEGKLKSPGKTIGSIGFINTMGAAVGSLLASFILVELLDTQQTIFLIGFIYLIGGLLIPQNWKFSSIIAKTSIIILCIISPISLLKLSLPKIGNDPNAEFGEVIEKWQGPYGDLAVTKEDFGVALRLNSNYSLGSIRGYPQEKFQADLPFLIKPDAKKIFFLGMGSGITAGSALESQYADVESVHVCEIVDDVITASEKYFTNFRGQDLTHGLHSDPRAKIMVADGRHYLMATQEKYDIINSDLFIPFRSGVGNLYSLDHYLNSKKRLTDGGIFVQWLPLYQLTQNEIGIIARTMVEAFDTVTMWKHNFQPGDEVVALIGHQASNILPKVNEESYTDRMRSVFNMSYKDMAYLNLPLTPETVTLFYSGNLTQSTSLLSKYPINSDDRPYIEYLAPRSFRQSADVSEAWFTKNNLSNFVEQIFEESPLDKDPYLANRTITTRNFAKAGHYFHQARIQLFNRQVDKASIFWEQFVQTWTKEPDEK